ncbi:MAG: S8 family serine peptidase [Planctomycetia bacterium]|nr:S8 family serine peptidase [Planctomycetia bacterium]
MNDKCVLFVTLNDSQGNLVANATLLLKPANSTASQSADSRMRFDERLGLYASEAVPPGDYILRAEAPGYVPQEIRLKLAGPQLYTSMSLGRQGEPYYILGGRRVYFEPDGQKIAALVRIPTSETDPQPKGSVTQAAPQSPALERLRALQPSSPDEPERPGLMIFDRAKLPRAAGDDPLERALRETPEVLDAGPLFKSRDNIGRFLSRFIEVIVEDGVTRERLEELVRPFQIHIYYQDGRNPFMFLLESNGIPGPDYGALPEQLAALPEIRTATSITSAHQETTALIPGDPNFALQFHDYVTRVTDAWEQVNPARNALSFGSADVIVAVHDAGIETTGGGTGITHPEFSGVVVGGTLATQPGLNANKVLFTFNFLASPMQVGNDASVGFHGISVAGTISAGSNGTVGTVGTAANTRLCSYIWSITIDLRLAHALDFMAGQDPVWRRGAAPYTAAEPFPHLLGTGGNPVPGADIINCSHTHRGPPPIAATDAALQRATLFGRRRRGTLIIAGAGNQDADCRLDGTWGENSNVIRVAASSLDLLLEEVRMNYSSFALVADRIVDFCAPSESQNVNPTVHQVPRMFGFIAPSRTTTGDLASTVGARAPITNAPVVGAGNVEVAAANLGNFAGGNTVIIRNTADPFFSELHTVTGTTAPNRVNLNRPLGYGYTLGNAEIIRLTGANNYTTQFGGTSASTPQASAIAALMLSVKPSLTWLEVRDLMRRTAVPINLRYRGSQYAAPPNFRYRWLDPAQVDLITPEGLLDITGGNKTIVAGPVQRGDRILTLNNTAGINPRQSLVIGAETKLNGVHPLAVTPNVINVDHPDEFEVGDTLFIGRNTQTVLIAAAAAGNTVIWVQSVDGFLPGDDITINPTGVAETVRIVNVVRMTNPPGAGQPANFGASDTGFTITRLNAAGAPIPGGLAGAHLRATVVQIANTQFEGPFSVNVKGATSLTLNNPVTRAHPDDRIVWKQGTEVKAVIRTLPGNQVEVDPLDFNHPFNTAGVENVRVGRVADYSLGFGFGRLDALEAVIAAKNFTHNERDLVIRNFLADDGVTNVGAQEVESPDIWARNDAPAAPAYADPGPHQAPEITVDPAIHIGNGRNDLEVAGVCTSAAEVTFTIEIDGTGAADTFKWNKDGGAPTVGVAIAAAAQPLSDGVSIRFAAVTGHTLSDQWIVKARQVAGRFIQLRIRNRGTLPYFTTSAFAPATSPNVLDVARSRILLCVSDGFPVSRFASIAAAPGPDDLQVIARYTGANARALYTVEITATAAAGDTFRWFRDGALVGAPTALAAGALDRVLNDGVQVRFGSHTGHTVGDRWNLYARSGVDAFLNIDHYREGDPVAVGAFDPSSGRAGTRTQTHVPIAGLAAGADQTDVVGWPEALRLPTNNPNRPKPAFPRRLFILGEVVPHDGALAGFTAKDNNNISFRELAFAKFRFMKPNGKDPLGPHVEVDNTGLSVTRDFRVEVRATAGTFSAERVRLKFTARKVGPTEEVRFFRNTAGAWGWDTVPPWATATAPLEARRPDGTQPAATGEQFDIQFGCTLTVDMSIIELVIEAEILSDFRDFPVATGRHVVAVFVIVPTPTGVQMAQTATRPRPLSHVFADMALITQTPELAFGPVNPASRTTRYRTTSLFNATVDVNAYMVVDGFVALQRDPANNETVNLILRPLTQPLAGFTPIRYFIYRGLRLTDFLKGNTGADAKLIRAQAGASPFLTDVWTTFLALNPGVTDMPATVLGYDPDTQTGSEPIDDLFFRVGGDQLPLAVRGLNLGRFHHGTGASNFGFQIIIEEGDFSPNLNYARSESAEIDISTMPSGNAAEQFALRLKQEEILNFLDLASFYGLHIHDGGRVEAPGGITWQGQDVFTNVVSRFHTKHHLYLDIRSENSSSLNFQRNYDGGGNTQLLTGSSATVLTPRAYATDGWPIVILDNSTPVATAADFNELHLGLPRNDNENPVLFVEHGQLLTPATNGAFVRNAELHTGAGQWTLTQGFRFPNTGPAGAKLGVAWVLRLYYGRMEVPTPTVPVPNTVLKTQKYTDNVFGPIDRVSRWAGTAGLKWISTQDNRYVDAHTALGWRQMMECGLAQQTGTTERVLLYAVTTASDTNSAFPFVPLRGITDGISDRPSFFAEAGLFGVYLLEHDQVADGATIVRTLQLRQNPTDGYPPTSVLLLGLSKAEFDSLPALSTAGLSTAYLRTLLLDGETQVVDPTGRTAQRYRVGLQGLKTADGTYQSEFPATEIRVYSVDRHLFASKAFADAEPLPTVYLRNFEEEKGTRQRGARERRIGVVTTANNSITIQNDDWRKDVVPGDQLKIDKSASNNGQYQVVSVTLTGADTVIVLAGGPGALTNTAPLGSAFTLPKAVEDYFIDRDQDGPIAGIPKTRDFVNNFSTQIAAIANNAAAQAALETRVDDVAQLLQRARARAQADRAHADDHERTLYWARLRMLVALKSHAFCLASISGRNTLVDRFEKKSRGYELNFGAAPGGSRKVLLTGFDPFSLSDDPERSNPSAAVALAFHGATVTSSGKTAYIETALFPVRYRDFDAGRVEDLVNPRLSGPGQVEMITTVSQNGSFSFFDLERFAGRRRGGYPDNEFVRQPPRQLGDNATHPAFVETTLPANVMVQGPFSTPPAPGQRVFFDQSFQAENPAASHAHPTASGTNSNVPAFALASITGQALQASGGDYLSNEIFYRVAHRRRQTASTTLTGHIHIPSPTEAGLGIADVIAQIETLIRRWLDSLP